MIGSLRVITGPTEEPFSVDELQRHLRVTWDDENGMLDSYLTAVRASAEKILDLAFLAQTLEWAFDAFPVAECAEWPAIELPRPPLQSVTSIAYVDPAGAPQVLSAGLYVVDTRSTPGRIVPAYGESWPAIREQPSGVVVRYIAGAATVADVPEDQRQMLRLAAATLYEFREGIVQGDEAMTNGLLEQFFAPYRYALVV